MGCDSNSLNGKARCGVRPEVDIIDPHPVQDHASTPSQSDYRAFGTVTAGDLRSPCSQPYRAPKVHYHGRGLTQLARRLTSNRALCASPALVSAA